jgi:hypothetical protein
MSQFSFPINPALTAIAMAYRNPDQVLIADKVLPRIPVAQLFKWMKYDLAQGFTVPDTKVGPKSEPNMVDFKGVELTSQVEDYGLDDLVTESEIRAFEAMPKPATGGPLSPQEMSVMYIMSLIKLDREVRVANLAFDANQYSASNKLTLSGTSQWSDTANSDPVAAIGDALDVPVLRPNKATFGRAAWTKFRRHPKVVQACNATNQGAGIVSRQQVAELFELQEIYVGDSFVNTARKGQATNLQRAWGKHCLLHYTSEQAATERQPVFGFTGQFGSQVAGTIPAPQKGLRGSELVRAGESVKEVISSPEVAFFFQNCVA